MNDHLDAAALDGLLAGAFQDQAAEERLSHLLFCEDCRRLLLEAHPEEGPLFLEQSFGEAPDWLNPQGYLASNPSLQQEVLEAPKLGDELARHSPPRRLLLGKNLRRFQTLPVAIDCFARGKRLWRHDPREASGWMELGLEILEVLPADRYPDKLLAGFRARGWAYRANSLRNLSALDEASKSFEQAWRWFWKGETLATEWAQLAALEASLRRAQRRFDQAQALLKDAVAIYREAGDRREEARLLVARAQALGEEGQVDGSVRVLEKVLRDFTDAELGEDLYAVALHNFACDLAEVGRLDESRRLLPEVRKRVARIDNRLVHLRLDWLEARIRHADGEHETALALYRKVRDAFVEEGIAYEGALASLDLAALYLETGCNAEAKELARQMLPVFRSRQIHREAAATGLVLIEALRTEVATVELVQDVAAYMRLAKTTRGL